MAAPANAPLLRRLARLYPEPASELNFSNSFELVAAVLLSAQCTDKKVNEVTPHLFERYPDFEALSKAPVESVETIIRPINYYKTKSKHLVGMAKLVMEKFGGSLPEAHDDLVTLPGVGRKTANVVVSELGSSHAIAVDTHVFRVSKRLGLANGTTPRKVEEELMQRFHRRNWRKVHHWLILHGRRVCKAQRPLCSECALLSLCPTGKRLISAKT